MGDTSRVLAVVPARYASTRFPGKVLARLGGRPLFLHTVDVARAAHAIDSVLVATEHAGVADAAREAGVEVVLTRADHPSGSDRIGEAIAGRRAEIVVNLQADEPLLPPSALDALVGALDADPAADVATLACAASPDEVEDSNAVKVVCSMAGRALYFSRAAIPAVHPSREPSVPTLRHLGVYAFRRSAFDAFIAAAPSALERQEGLEQLRLLEMGRAITVAVVERVPPGVDTPEDLLRCERILASPDRAM